jgi:hypothetical protein
VTDRSEHDMQSKYSENRSERSGEKKCRIFGGYEVNESGMRWERQAKKKKSMLEIIEKRAQRVTREHLVYAKKKEI